MIVTQPDQIDFTMMYITHNALRRDVRRLSAAATAGTAGTPQVHAGWENFKTQLHIHHTVEDNDLWPRLYRAVAEQPDELGLLTAMQDEHAILDPLLTAVDRALAGGGIAPSDEHLQKLAAALNMHLKHEEDSALPLIQSVLTPADWRGFAAAMRRRQGYKGARIYVPWLLDGANPAERKRILAAFPAPLHLLNKLRWEPRYRRQNLWTVR